MAERFWTKVEVRGPDDCWPWTGATSRGYGYMRVNGRNEVASRVAFYLEYGRWPDPWALHSCDNRPCANIKHIHEGTRQDNIDEMIGRGRYRNNKGNHSVMCSNGHIRTAENTKVNGNHWECRICRRERSSSLRSAWVAGGKVGGRP